MRWVIMVVVALIAFMIAIFAAGAVLPRKHMAAVITDINQPPAALWQTINDQTQATSWRSDLQSVERKPDRNGHLVWLETYKNGMKLELEDTEAAAPRKLVRTVRDTGNMFSGQWEILISPLGTTGSTIRITETGEVPNPFFRFMSRFVFGHTKTLEQYLTALAGKYGEKPHFRTEVTE
jgi:hypothetical protein